MIVQVNYQPGKSEEKEDFESYWRSITISGFGQEQLEKLINICTRQKIKFETSHETSFPQNYISVSSGDINFLITEFNRSGLNYISDEIKKAIENYENYSKLPVRIGKVEFNEPVIMGILNVTPDSFSDGGKYLDKNIAAEYALEMISNGADIIDVGGESTRPGSDPVSEEEEIKRVIPVIEEIIKRNPEAVISIDTTKSNVAREACKSGAKIINDISGLTFEPDIAYAAAEYSAALIVMHIKGSPKTMQINPVYDNLIYELYEFLHNQTETAKKTGVKNIIIDPGIGFGKTIEDNFEILRRLSDFKSLGYPILAGLSRKSFLGKSLKLELNERETATAIAETVALRAGAKIIRTHNVFNAVQVRKILNFIYSD